MGRRAKKAPVQTKKKVTLSKRFKCPFCANDETVECKMDFRAGIGSLACRLCAASYQMPIHHLHEPVDVFSEWLDDCEAAAHGRPTGNAPTSDKPDIPQYDESDDDDDDELPESSGVNNNKNNSNNKKKAASASSSKAGKSKTAAAAKPSYSDLGLDDSDDDDDDSD